MIFDWNVRRVSILLAILQEVLRFALGVHFCRQSSFIHVSCDFTPIAILTVTSPIVINVQSRDLLSVETRDSFVLWLAKFQYQQTCL